MSEDIQTRTLNYTAEGTNCLSYLALPVGTAPSAGVIVVHEWWGLNDYPKKRADMLAQLGYAALAVDMYGDGRTGNSIDESSELMNAALGTEGAVPARFQAGLKALCTEASVAEDRVAAIGYCFGGAVVLGMARAGLPLKAVASFHGALETEHPATKGNTSARILVCHGNDDAMVTAEHVQAFKQEMDAAEANYEFVGYDGAEHGFSNPGADEKKEKFGLPVGYHAATDTDSWARLQTLLQEELG